MSRRDMSDEELAEHLLGKKYVCVGCGELWHEAYLEDDRCPDCLECGDIIMTDLQRYDEKGNLHPNVGHSKAYPGDS